MTKAECMDRSCHNPATRIVKIEAHVHAGDSPIVMVLGLSICDNDACLPKPEDLPPHAWDIMDTWALQGRKALCDRSLTEITGIPLDGDEAKLLQLTKAEADERRRGMH